jgi:serine protease Do
MRRLLATILLALLLQVRPATSVPPVQPLQFQQQTYCTTWSINERQGYWATNAHCAVLLRFLQAKYNTMSTIDGRAAAVIYMDSFTDTAVLHADAHAEAYRLARKDPEVGDSVRVIGFPLAIALTTTNGYIAARGLWFYHETFDNYVLSDMLDITTAPGNSGSPVLDKRGEVVGLLWGGINGYALSASIPLDSLRTSIGRFFEAR